jgi:3-dehydroquinate synthetase
MRLDKKVRGGEIRFVLARKIGKVLWGRRIPDVYIREALDS